MRFSPALALYLAASRLAAPLARPILKRRLSRGKEDAARLSERLGYPGAPRPSGRLVWLHGASLGESLTTLPLIAALRRTDPGIGILVTTGTLSSATRMTAELPEGAAHQFVPVDTAAAVRRFLGHWRPDLAVWVESEFWPCLMVETARSGTPMALVNARISERSAARWRRAPGMAAALLGLFRTIVTQDAETRTRLVALGADPARVREGGNLKMLIPPPGGEPGEVAALSASLGGRPVWLAASTHDPEEGAILSAHRAASRALPGLLTILAPRHPERGDELAAWLGAEGVRFARRSAGELPGAETEVWLADTLGEMGLWFRLAPLAFVGGSLARMGGHNPFEPAALGAAILHGPDVANFAPAYRALAAAGAARQVQDAEELGDAVRALLSDGDARAGMADRARTVLAEAAPDADALAAELLAMIGTAGGAR